MLSLCWDTCRLIDGLVIQEVDDLDQHLAAFCCRVETTRSTSSSSYSQSHYAYSQLLKPLGDGLLVFACKHVKQGLQSRTQHNFLCHIRAETILIIHDHRWHGLVLGIIEC
jgi:hypothetical protein